MDFYWCLRVGNQICLGYMRSKRSLDTLGSPKSSIGLIHGGPWFPTELERPLVSCKENEVSLLSIQRGRSATN